jgi:hypothetical protein
MVNLARPLHQTHHAEIFEVPLRSVHQDYEMKEPQEMGLYSLYNPVFYSWILRYIDHYKYENPNGNTFYFFMKPRQQ